mmetsp:Transcript_154/g.223  ORF Transcript_154/g.223 Transcript_154/m.223 type:complete len:212 (+) Transcript_154:1519-2154(+)
MELPVPFYAFTVLWSLLWAVTKIRAPKDKKDHFSENLFLLTGNQVVGLMLSILSLYFDEETYMRESTVLSWYGSFFIVDLLDCVYRKDVVFFIHAVLSLTLCRVNFLPKYYGLRTGSKGVFTELSTLFLNKWKKSKKKIDFQMFAVVFFFCRLCWVPFFMIRAAKEVDMDGFVICASVAFYLLQVVFFGKIITILRNYKEKAKDGEKPKEE